MRASQHLLKAVVNTRGTVRVLESSDLPAGECRVLVFPIGKKPREKPRFKPLKLAPDAAPQGVARGRDEVPRSPKTRVWENSGSEARHLNPGT